MSSPPAEPLTTPFVPHPQADAVFERLEFVLAHQKWTKKGLGIRLTGATNTGKSAMLKEFERRHPPLHELTRTIREVLYVHIPERARVDDVYIAILRAANDPAALLGTEKLRRVRVREVLDNIGNRLLMLDEPHHLTEERSTGARVAVTHLSKSFQETGRGIVWAGVKSVDDLAAQSDELARRFRDSIRLGPYSARNPEELKAFQAFADGYSKSVRDVEVPPFGSDRDWFSRLLVASQGSVGNFVDVIALAVTHARMRGDSRLTLRHLSLAWESFSTSMEKQLQALRNGGRRSTLANPFEMKTEDVNAHVAELSAKERA